MIEKDIEAAIVAAIKALALPGLDVAGSWQAAAPGGLKGEESPSAPAAVAVRVSPRAFDSFALPEATFNVAVSLVVRLDLCPDGSDLETYAAPLADLLHSWNLSLHAFGADGCGLEIPGFAPGSVHLFSSSGPELDRERGVWSVIFNLQLKGVAPLPPNH